MSSIKFVHPSRFDVWLVALDPTLGREIKKTRPCVILTPNEMSDLSTVTLAPMTTKGFDFPVRIKCKFKDKSNLILLDHLRAVDKKRLIKKLGVIDNKTAKSISSLLVEMFTY